MFSEYHDSVVPTKHHQAGSLFTLSPIIMEVEHFPNLKETNLGRERFSTSMIVG